MLALRKRVFSASQSEIAEIAGTTQATVSRWEKGELQPDRAQLDLLRNEAKKRGLTWSDAWIFEAAPEVAGDQSIKEKTEAAA